MRFSLLPTFVLLGTALADGASILAALSNISNDTLALNHTVATWDGGPLTALPIVSDSLTLLGALDDGTKTARKSSNLTFDEAIAIVGPTLTLVSDVQSTLQTIVDAKPKFAALLLGPVVEGILKTEKKSADKFSTAVIAKVPSSLQSTAQSLVAPIDTAFDNAIAAYKGVL